MAVLLVPMNPNLTLTLTLTLTLALESIALARVDGILKTNFDHEKGAVYREAIRFVAWAGDLLKTLPQSLAVHDQLDRASTSIALNIAEGNGKYTAPDRCWWAWSVAHPRIVFMRIGPNMRPAISS